jgi:diguanylate cyclase (GGDEF)-like protein/PAS domain S-box-containing protein
MKNWFLRWINPSVLIRDDEKKQQQAVLLHVITIIVLLFVGLAILGGLLDNRTPRGVLFLDLLIIANTLLVRYWLYRGNIRLASLCLVIITFVLFSIVIFLRGTTHSPTTAAYILIVVIAGLLFDRRGIWVTTLASSLTIIGFELAENAGWLPPEGDKADISYWVIYTALIGATGILTYYANQITQRALLRFQAELFERSRVEAELRRLTRAVQWQRDLAQELAVATSIRPALSLCLQRILTVTRMDSGGVYLVDRSTGDFELAVSQGLSDDFVERMRLVPASSPLGQGIMTGKPLFGVIDQLQGQDFLAEKAEGLKAFAALPLVSQGQVIASFHITSHSLDAIDPVEQDLIVETALNLGNTLARIQTREDLQQSHDRLRLSEEQFRTVFESSVVAMAMVNLDGQFFRVNQSLCRMLGFEEAELLARSVVDVTFPDDLQATQEIVRRLTRGERDTAQVEKRYRHRSGATVWASTNANLVRGWDHKPLHIVVIIQDTTARKRAEILQQAIYRISETAAVAGSLEELYPALHQIIGELLPARNLYFALHDPARDTISFPYQVDYDFEAYIEKQGGRSLAEYTVRTGQAQMVDIERYKKLEQAGEVQPVADNFNFNWLGIPLKGASGQVLGLLAVRTNGESEGYTEQDKEILSFVSTQVGLAIERKRAEEEQHVAFEKYRILFEAFPLGITISDATGKILETNRAAERFLGVAPEVHQQRNLGDPAWQLVRADGTWMPPDEYPGMRALHEQRRIENTELGIRMPGGKIIWLDVTAAPIPLEGYGVAVAYGDITPRRQAETALDKQRQIFQHMIDKAHTFLVYLDPDFNFVEVNAGYAQTCRREPGELIGKNHFYFYPDAENEEIFRQVRSTFKPVFLHDKPFIFPDQPERGVTYWDWVLSPDLNANGQLEGLVFSLSETTARKQLEEELQQSNLRLNEQLNLVTELKDLLREQVVRDTLTGLHNRRYLYEVLPGEFSRAQREGSPISFIMMDIDHFKSVNDRYGHAAGDEVLKAVGQLLTRHTRGSDIACRYGGEEFLLVMFGTNLDVAVKRAEQFRLECASEILGHMDRKISVTISLGVAVYPEHGEILDEVLNNADRALYISKQRGRNRVTAWVSD